MMISFKIPLIPTGQARPKHCKRKTANGEISIAYKTKEQQQRELSLMSYFNENRPVIPMVGPIKLRVVAKMPRPKSHYGTGKNTGILKHSAPSWHTAKPDSDNILKMLKDCMEGLFYKNDSQVCDEAIIKSYGCQLEPWGIWIEIGEIT